MLADFAIPKGDAVAFSNGGHLLAAVGKGSTISVFSSCTYACVARLKGHVSTVTGMSWSSEDEVLVSTSSGGATYFWDVSTQQRIKDLDYVDKTSNFQTVLPIGNGQAAVVRNVAGEIRHIQVGGDL